MEKSNLPAIIDIAKEKFEIACSDAGMLAIAQTATSAFIAVSVVKNLREILTDEVINEVFMPLMNTKVGFLTDRTGKPNYKGEIKPLYKVDVVRDAVIDAICIGLLPTGNQMNILADRMYPTKEGYTALLKKHEVKYLLNIGIDTSKNTNFAEIPVTVNYEFKGVKNQFVVIASVKKDAYSSHDQLRGKAERRAKKALFEYITGCDFGEGDELSTIPNFSEKDISKKPAYTDAQVVSEPAPPVERNETVIEKPTERPTVHPTEQQAAESAFNAEKKEEYQETITDLDIAISDLSNAKNLEHIKIIWDSYPNLQTDSEFKSAIKEAKAKFAAKKESPKQGNLL